MGESTVSQASQSLDTIEISQKINDDIKADDMQSNLMSMVPIILIFFVMYFLLIRPQDKKRRQHEEMIKAVKRGDSIVTIGGIYGTITKVDDKDKTFMLEISKDTQIKVARSAIAEFIDAKITDKIKQ